MYTGKHAAHAHSNSSYFTKAILAQQKLGPFQTTLAPAVLPCWSHCGTLEGYTRGLYLIKLHHQSGPSITHQLVPIIASDILLRCFKYGIPWELPTWHLLQVQLSKHDPGVAHPGTPLSCAHYSSSHFHQGEPSMYALGHFGQHLLQFPRCHQKGPNMAYSRTCHVPTSDPNLLKWQLQCRALRDTQACTIKTLIILPRQNQQSTPQ